jgi:hypothetical protein
MAGETLDFKDYLLAEIPEYVGLGGIPEKDAEVYAIVGYLDLPDTKPNEIEIGLILTRDELQVAYEMPETRPLLLRGYNVPANTLLLALNCVASAEADANAGNLRESTAIWPRPHFPMLSYIARPG